MGIEVRNAGRAAVRRREVVRREAMSSGVVVYELYGRSMYSIVVKERDCRQSVASS